MSTCCKCDCHKPKPVETFTHEGSKVALYTDDDPSSPREYDNLSHMVCAHRRYTLGDEQRREAETEEELRERVPGIVAILPLYLYDHSGITISTGTFGCAWDSGQVGWAYVTQESAESMGCVGGDWTEEKLCESIRMEVEEYDKFLTGDVYGYVITEPDGSEGDSCWSLLGIECARQEARCAIGLTREEGAS